MIVERMTEPHLFLKGDLFEQVCTGGIPDLSDFYLVNRSLIGEHTLFVCGEVDAVDDDDKVIEIKMYDPTSSKVLTRHQNWFQSYIMGIEDIRYGVTSDKEDWDSVCGTESVKVSQLVEKHDAEKHFCALKLVLDKLKSKLTREDSVYLMHLQEGSSNVELYQVKAKQTTGLKSLKPPPKEIFDFHFSGIPTLWIVSVNSCEK